MYRIRGADQKEYGPISAEVVRQWISEGRANGSTLLQSDGSQEWQPLSAVPEFSQALTNLPPAPTASRASPTVAASPPKTSPMAVTSLVLGILGLFSCGITALIGVVFGVIALTRIRKSEGRLGGKTVAVAGICASGACLVMGLSVGAIGAGLLLPALAKAKDQAQRVQCVNNLKQIGLAARMWSEDHNNIFPPDFLSMAGGLGSPKVLICPGDSRPVPVDLSSWAQFTPQNVSYQYLTPGIKGDGAMSGTVVFQCPIHGTVCYGDGSVAQQPRGAWNIRSH